MKVEVTKQAIDPWRAAQEYQAAAKHLYGKFGATTVFVGTMRDFNEGDQVRRMTLEHYPGMTEKHLESIAQQAKSDWDLLDVLLMHRVGVVEPSDVLVCVVVWSAHRKEAYAANQFIMDDLKAKAPFWKREEREQGARWVENNT